MLRLAAERRRVRLGSHADEDFPFAASFDVAFVTDLRSLPKQREGSEREQAFSAEEDPRSPHPLAVGP